MEVYKLVPGAKLRELFCQLLIPRGANIQILSALSGMVKLRLYVISRAYYFPKALYHSMSKKYQYLFYNTPYILFR